MNKLDAFISLGRMKVKCEGNKKVTKDLSNLYIALEHDDLNLVAETIGKILERVKKEFNIKDELDGILAYVNNIMMQEKYIMTAAIKEMDIGKLNLSNSSYHALAGSEIDTVSDLVDLFNSGAMFASSKFSNICLNEVKQKLKYLGLI